LQKLFGANRRQILNESQFGMFPSSPFAHQQKPSQTIITLSTIHLSLVIKDGEATKKAYAKCSKKKEDVAFAQSMRVGRASQAVSVDFEVEGPSRRNTWEVS